MSEPLDLETIEDHWRNRKGLDWHGEDFLWDSIPVLIAEIKRLRAPSPVGPCEKHFNAKAPEVCAICSMEEIEKLRAVGTAPRPMKLRSEVEILLKGNGGPIDGDNGIEYVMVRRQDFEALELAWKEGVK